MKKQMCVYKENILTSYQNHFYPHILPILLLFLLLTTVSCDNISELLNVRSAFAYSADQEEYDAYDDNDDEVLQSVVVQQSLSNSASSIEDMISSSEDSIITINILANDRLAYGKDRTFIVESVSQPRYGRAVLNYDNSVTYIPYMLAMHSGSSIIDTFSYDALTYSATGDLVRYTAGVTINVEQSNDVPIAYNSTVRLLKNTELAFYLDTYDEDNDDLVYSIISAPTYGNYELDSDNGRIIYTPYSEWTGFDFMTFAVSDNSSFSIPAMVTFEVVDHASDEELTQSQPENYNSANNSEANQPDTESGVDAGVPADNSAARSDSNTTSNNTGYETNSKPIANAGDSQTIISGMIVQLDGNASVDPDGDSILFRWSQIEGPNVSLLGSDSASPTFSAPELADDSPVVLTFELSVSDDAGLTDTSTVSITVIEYPDIQIDIIPSDQFNEINTNKVNEKIAIAIFGDSSLSINDIDENSLMFGPSRALQKETEKVDSNEDGHIDLIAYFRVGDLGLTPADKSSCLVGIIDTANGDLEFEACGPIKITNQNKK